MIGLEAIESYNGWAMASIGAAIVFLGLILLSFAVSQLHRLLALGQRKSAHGDQLKRDADSDESLAGRPLSAEALSGIHQLKLLTERIGNPFPLPRMIDLAEKTGMTHPHAVANQALVAGVMIPDPDGRGYYTWEEEERGRV